MLDPKEQAKGGFRAHVAREQERQGSVHGVERIGGARRGVPFASGDPRVPVCRGRSTTHAPTNSFTTRQTSI
mgnify:CR=1 FL=1